ncbi:hypothetical protein M433DRAFT_67568 [Acidomyces richmondensis BFW]|nr:MAG: hypothetical protein FE78DRAFT_146408 [Acidomyces sp. 'richmondensis']KYG45309.1 hypothetical protein M433DRAFT_67568 [Acidomyces richmondensis BFW]
MPSSGTAGFFQPPPQLRNQFEDDFILRNIFDFYIPHDSPAYKSISNELQSFGHAVIQPHIFQLIADAEKHPPTVSTHSTFGVPRTVLHTSHGWQELQRIGIREGIVAIPYEAANSYFSRIHQFLKYHLWSGSCAVVTCPSAMADGAARLLARHIGEGLPDRDVLSEAFRRLICRDPIHAWTSGQWMTERSGGSDVRGTETVAKPTRIQDGKDANGVSLGPWSVSGFKWFSSATDSQMSILLARSPGGLSAFYAPMRRTASDGSSEFNGVSIQRLKPKLGTKALPTAELVLDNMRAYLIGKEGEGIREISTILTITRIHTAMSAVGFWGRGLAIARAYACVRKVEGKLLKDNPAHMSALAVNTIAYAAHMHLVFFAVMLLGITEQAHRFETDSRAMKIRIGIWRVEQANALLRILTPVAKAQCSQEAIVGLQRCMESLGGIGYLEDEQEFNIARLLRDAGVLSIWEGTTDVMSADIQRVIKGKEGFSTLKILEAWVLERQGRWDQEWHAAKQSHHEALEGIKACWQKDANNLKVIGRKLLETLAWLVAGVLLIENARMTRSSAAREIACRWSSNHRPHNLDTLIRSPCLSDVVAANSAIVFPTGTSDRSAKI